MFRFKIGRRLMLAQKAGFTDWLVDGRLVILSPDSNDDN
jgi:hypothetical protein